MSWLEWCWFKLIMSAVCWLWMFTRQLSVKVSTCILNLLLLWTIKWGKWLHCVKCVSLNWHHTLRLLKHIFTNIRGWSRQSERAHIGQPSICCWQQNEWQVDYWGYSIHMLAKFEFNHEHRVAGICISITTVPQKQSERRDEPGSLRTGGLSSCCLHSGQHYKACAAWSRPSTTCLWSDLGEDKSVWRNIRGEVEKMTGREMEHVTGEVSQQRVVNVEKEGRKMTEQKRKHYTKWARTERKDTKRLLSIG